MNDVNFLDFLTLIYHCAFISEIQSLVQFCRLRKCVPFYLICPLFCNNAFDGCFCFELILKAEDRAHRRGQTSAVNIYIFCAKVLFSFVFQFSSTLFIFLILKDYGFTLWQDTTDESHWQNLNKSLRCVSSATNGKYDALQEIAVLLQSFNQLMLGQRIENLDLLFPKEHLILVSWQQIFCELPVLFFDCQNYGLSCSNA